MSGSYDPSLDLLYWAVGNPCPDYNGADRKGDNLYTDSVLALKPETGELKWYFQFTPHDTHDWDADEPLMLVDETFAGEAAQAARAGQPKWVFLRARPNQWAISARNSLRQEKHLGQRLHPDGKPILLPNSEPTVDGTLVCPGSGTNWRAASYSPTLKLFFVSASDACSISRLIPAPFEMGKRYFNGAGSRAPDTGGKSIRALDIQTGKVIWEYPQTADAVSESGPLSTNGGLVFIGEDSGDLHCSGRQNWKAFVALANERDFSGISYDVHGGR